MVSFKEANQARLSLKMICSNFGWYNESIVIPFEDDYCVVISVSKIDNKVRKVIPTVHYGVSIKVEVDNR